MQPPTLAYDDLPPGSDMRRAHDGEALQITVPAGEPPPPVLKQTAYDALVSGATASWALLLLAFVIFYLGIRINRISGPTLTWAWALFAVFCAALIMLVAWIRYGVMLDALRLGRRQMTVLAATRDRLLVETSGPFGTASYDWAREAIAQISVGRGALQDDRARLHRLPRLIIVLRDGRSIVLLPGRDPRELKWVQSSLTQLMNIAAR